MNVGGDGCRHLPWASATVCGGHRYILFSVYTERQRKTLNGRTKACVEKNLACIDVDRSEMPIQVTGKCDSTGR